jgi:hypothetical protein
VRESERKALKNYEYGQHMAALLQERSKELREMEEKFARANQARGGWGCVKTTVQLPLSLCVCVCLCE